MNNFFKNFIVFVNGKGKNEFDKGAEIRAYIILEVEYINQQQLEKWKDFTIQ